MKSSSSALRPRPLPETAAARRPWFTKPSPRFFRARTLVRIRLAPLRGVFAGS